MADRGRVGSLVVGSKRCADKVWEKKYETHRNRIRQVRSTTDMSEPSTFGMMKTNLKKERLLEERYTEIDRENQHLLRKMADAMKQKPYERKDESRHTITLNRSGRKAELLRITKENHRMLKSIQEVQPVYSAKKWEKHFKDSEYHLKNRCTYPVITRLPRVRSEPSVLLPMDPAAPQGSSSQVAGSAGEEGVVLKEGKLIGSVYYLLEMSTDGRALTISAYDGQTQTSLELVVKESKHRQLYRECSGDYSQIAARLRVDGNRLTLDSAGVEQL